MQILLALMNDGLKSDALILKYNTEYTKGEIISLSDKLQEVPDCNLSKTSGLCFSGDNLCVGIQDINGNDYIAFFNVYDDTCGLFKCKHSEDIGNIISIYPGKLYLDSYQNNSIIGIDFDHVNLSFFNDEVHYIVNSDYNFGIRSLYNFKNTWFIAFQKRNQIYDLSNDRVVYSAIYGPNCIFFNSKQRMCFIETDRYLFHCGDDIFFVGSKNNKPVMAMEDVIFGGYWVVCGTELHLIDYIGSLIDVQDLSSYGGRFTSMIEPRGKFCETISDDI